MHVLEASTSGTAQPSEGESWVLSVIWGLGSFRTLACYVLFRSMEGIDLVRKMDKEAALTTALLC